jgi:hypothetical protein
MTGHKHDAPHQAPQGEQKPQDPNEPKVTSKHPPGDDNWDYVMDRPKGENSGA